MYLIFACPAGALYLKFDSSELLPVLDVFAMKNEYLKKLVEIFNGNGSSHDIQPSQNEEKGQGRDACSDNEVNPSVDQQQKQQKQQSGASAPPPLPPPPTSFLNIPAELFPYRIQIPIILGLKAFISSTTCLLDTLLLFLLAS